MPLRPLFLLPRLTACSPRTNSEFQNSLSQKHFFSGGWSTGNPGLVRLGFSPTFDKVHLWPCVSRRINHAWQAKCSPARKGRAPARPAAPASSALASAIWSRSLQTLIYFLDRGGGTHFWCVPWAGFHFLMWLAGSSDRNAFLWRWTAEKGSLCQHGAATLFWWHLSSRPASEGENGSDLFGNSLWTCRYFHQAGLFITWVYNPKLAPSCT